MSNIPTLTTSFRAAGSVPKRRLVTFGAGDNSAALAAGAAVAIIGASTDIDVADGKPVDVIRAGIAPVEYGATVAKGDPLTSDASGKAVKAAAGQRCGGFAEVAGVAGDIGAIHIAPGFAA